MHQRIVKFAAAFLFCGAALVSVAHADVASDKAQIAQVEQSWIAAGELGNTQAIDEILHPEYVMVSEGGRFEGKIAAVSVKKPGDGFEQKIASMSIRVYGDTAVVNGVCEYRLKAGAPAQRAAFTDVFVRGGPRGWQAVSSQGTPQK
jgi:hypothetical protein